MILSRMHDDARFMRRALTLAKRGGSRVFPNPMVGCVIVNNGKIVGEGFHAYFGGPHAEVNALARAGKNAAGSTLYVTLEPCNHYGKTPPCTTAIIDAGVKRVVASTLDLNKQMRGNGMKELSMNGVDVSVGVLKKHAVRLNSHYLKTRRNAIASVIVKAAMSADGKIATKTGDSKWISSKQSRTFVHKLRSTVDAVVVGKNTVLRDDPLLTSHGIGRNPVRVVLDAQLTVPMRSRVFNGSAPTIVFFNYSNQKAKLEVLRSKRIMTVRLPWQNGKIELKKVIAALNKFSLHKILIEGGGETIASAIESGLATDLVLFIAPIIIGGINAKTPVEGIGIANVRNAVRLLNPTMRRMGRDFMLTAKLGQSRSGRWR